MTRLLSRLSRVNANSPQQIYFWAQRVCEEIESLLDVAREYMPEIAAVQIAASYTGAVDPADQLPMTVACKRYNDATDVTSSCTWSRSVVSGGITCSINASTGALTITAVTSSGVIEVTSVRTVNGTSMTLTTRFNVYLNVGAAPSTGSGGGGSTASDTSFSTVNTGTLAAISDELTVTVGSSGNVELAAYLSAYVALGTPDGDYNAIAEWRWWDGAAYVAVGAPAGTDPACNVVDVYISPGALSIVEVKTGLTPAASEKFQLYACCDGHTETMSFSGEASAIP